MKAAHGETMKPRPTLPLSTIMTFFDSFQQPHLLPSAPSPFHTYLYVTQVTISKMASLFLSAYRRRAITESCSLVF